MKLTRKVSGYILLVVSILLIAIHFIAKESGDIEGFPTFLGMGVIFLIFGVMTTISCMIGEEECEVEAP